MNITQKRKIFATIGLLVLLAGSVWFVLSLRKAEAPASTTNLGKTTESNTNSPTAAPEPEKKNEPVSIPSDNNNGNGKNSTPTTPTSSTPTPANEDPTVIKVTPTPEPTGVTDTPVTPPETPIKNPTQEDPESETEPVAKGYRIIAHQDGIKAMDDYKAELSKDLGLAGNKLRASLKELYKVETAEDVGKLSRIDFMEAVLATKDSSFLLKPGYGPDKDWSADDVKVLRELSVAVPVEIFAYGEPWGTVKLHDKPFHGYLLYTADNALMSNNHPDYEEIMDKSKTSKNRFENISEIAFNKLFERRLLPLFRFANNEAAAKGKKAIVTVPIFFCDHRSTFQMLYSQFIHNVFDCAIKNILKKYSSELENIDLVYYGTHAKGAESVTKYDSGLKYRVCSYGTQNFKSQLEKPENYKIDADENYTNHILFSIATMSPVRFPGDTFLSNQVFSDGAFKAKCTSSMSCLLPEVEAKFDPKREGYYPVPISTIYIPIYWYETPLPMSLKGGKLYVLTMTKDGDKIKLNLEKKDSDYSEAIVTLQDEVEPGTSNTVDPHTNTTNDTTGTGSSNTVDPQTNTTNDTKGTETSDTVDIQANTTNDTTGTETSNTVDIQANTTKDTKGTEASDKKEPCFKDGDKGYSIVTHEDTMKAVDDYKNELSKNLGLAGHNLRASLKKLFKVEAAEGVSKLSRMQFLEAILASKVITGGAAGENFSPNHSWSKVEGRILGNLNVAMPVKVFDNGEWSTPVVHDQPFDGYLLYTPGALLTKGSPDYDDCVVNGNVVVDVYNKLYERRLLPLLQFANDEAAAKGKKAIVAFPGLGCGIFSNGVSGNLHGVFDGALRYVLNKYASELANIDLVYYGRVDGGTGISLTYGNGLKYRMSVKGEPGFRTQLEKPENFKIDEKDDFSNHLLFTVVAWSQICLPGNTFYGGGGRGTDDAVKASATSSMSSLFPEYTDAKYDKTKFQYLPKEGMNWKDVAKSLDFHLSPTGGRLQVLKTSQKGNKIELKLEKESE